MGHFSKLLLLLIAVSAGAQQARFDSQALGPKGPLPNVIVSLCGPTATGIPCSPQVTSTTDSGGLTACSLGAPVTPTGSSICQGTTDALGNFGFWVTPGAYQYCLTGTGITGKCYQVTYTQAGPGGGITGSGTTNAIPKFTAASSVGNSSLTDNGTNVVTSEIFSAGSYANNLGAFASTTSAQLLGVISDETGSGSLVFANTPALVTPNIGAATGSSLTLSTPGTTSACIINGIRQVGSSCYATIAACYAALSAGETCQIPPNYAETLAANLVLNKKKTTLQAMGGCSINEGAFNVQVSQGADDVSIITPFAHSSDQAGGNQGCMFLGYTGAGAAIDIGSSAGFTYNTLIRGIVVDLSSAAASAIGFRRTNGVAGPMEYDEVVGGGVSGQIGFQFVGTGAFFDGTSNLIGLECNYSASSTNGKCVQFSGANQNGYSFLGDHSNTGGSANGSVCIDVAGTLSSKIDLGGFYCDVAATALTVESTANTAVRGFLIVDSGVTLVANFAAGSNGNQVWTNTRSIGSQLVTDNGTAVTNSVINGFDNQWNSRRWRVISESGATGFEIVDQSDNSQAIAKGVGGATHIDSSAGNPVRTNQNTGAGVEFWNAGASVLTIDPGGTIHPGVAAAVGLGTTALPFLNLFTGTAATNNFKFQPAATTGARIITIADPLSPTTVGLPLLIASGTSTLTANATLAAVTSQAAITTAGTGILTTDTIEWSYASAPTAGDSLCHVSPYATAGNVNFVRTNPTAAAQNVSAIVINWRVIR